MTAIATMVYIDFETNNLNFVHNFEVLIPQSQNWWPETSCFLTNEKSISHLHENKTISVVKIRPKLALFSPKEQK